VGLVTLLALSDVEWARFARPQTTEPSPLQTCGSHSSMVENVRHYDFFGAREGDAASSLRQRLLVTTDYQGRQRRFTGQTDWHIEWRACFEPDVQKCRIGGVTTTVHVTYTLPRWADRDAAPPGLRDRWDRYATSLAAHEKGHGAIAQEVARLIETALVGQSDEEGCATLDSRSAAIVDEVMQRGEAMQREYDRATSHGGRQGALFPF
jgi:predicted secreted Zn-dependent protease